MHKIRNNWDFYVLTFEGECHGLLPLSTSLHDIMLQ